MLGHFRIFNARKACVQALYPFVARPDFLDPWPPQFWRDPFVIGFVITMVGIISNHVTGGKLNTEQRGHVLMGTLKDVGGWSPEFTDRVAALANAKDPAFMLGGRNAETVITYIMDLHTMPGDPDVASAIAAARTTTVTGSVNRAQIGGALIQMLFTQLAEERLDL